METPKYRKYETIYMLRPNITEDVIKKTNERIFDIINNKGKLLVVDNWGLRKTAYPVQKQHKAYFFHLTYAGSPGLVADVELQCRIAEDVRKHHSIKIADTVPAEELKKEVKLKATSRSHNAE